MDRKDVFLSFSAFLTKRELVDVYDAYWMSKNTHHKQKRAGGGRYFDHPKAVALILVEEFGIKDSITITDGLLHDVLEDTYVSPQNIRARFGNTVIRDVLRLSKCTVILDPKTGTIVKAKKPDPWADIKGRRVVLVKMADRIHNLRTMSPWSPLKRLEYILEAEREIFPKVIKYQPRFVQKFKDEIEEQRVLLSL